MSQAATAAAEVVERSEDVEGDQDSGWKTILFNCRCHTFDEVERQLIKATRCTLSQARRLSMEVHSQGLAIVYRGARERCEAAAMVLEEIGLLVKVSE